ncbi:MAG: methyltransferase domain-containing protein [Chloroflexi bacterium]|nr:methyltransferase domain-containing protein [Chloroflexota bacterium]MBL7061682.1 methyltransferase domain-containing protein [Dehalococcoidia bacterium]
MEVNYTDISKTYDSYRSYPESLIKKIIALGRISQGKKVLDLGCGTGSIASQLRTAIKADTIGVDASFAMLKVAKDKSLEVICTDIDNQQLPFRDGSFDTVIVAYVIHQIKNLAPLLSECYRVLRGGVLVLLTSSHKQIENQHPVIKDFFPSYIDIDKGRFPDIHHIDYLLDSLGLKDIKHEEITLENIPIDYEYLQKVKSKYVSTYYLIPQSEFENGVKQLEAFITNSKQPEFKDWHGMIICGLKTIN